MSKRYCESASRICMLLLLSIWLVGMDISPASATEARHYAVIQVIAKAEEDLLNSESSVSKTAQATIAATFAKIRSYAVAQVRYKNTSYKFREDVDERIMQSTLVNFRSVLASASKGGAIDADRMLIIYVNKMHFNALAYMYRLKISSEELRQYSDSVDKLMLTAKKMYTDNIKGLLNATSAIKCDALMAANDFLREARNVNESYACVALMDRSKIIVSAGLEPAALKSIALEGFAQRRPLRTIENFIMSHHSICNSKFYPSDICVEMEKIYSQIPSEYR